LAICLVAITIDIATIELLKAKYVFGELELSALNLCVVGNMKTLTHLFILIFPFFVKGQNLIPNPSFEDINYCETNIPCSPSGWYSVSNIPYGYQNNLSKPSNGKHSVAFLIAFEQEIRTYWQTVLLCNLQAGKEYVISFKLYAPNIDFEPGYFGVYLGDKLFRSKNDTIIQMDSQITIPRESLMLLKNGWYKITLPFKATGNEKYVLLGNFNRDSNKVILGVTGNKARFLEYYIDNISLESIDKKSGRCSEYQRNSDSLYAANIRHADFHSNESVQIFSDAQNIVFTSKPDTLLLGNIHFKFGSDKLNDTKALNEYFDSTNHSNIDKIEIVGYTDSVGSQSYNLRLSERRAASVKKYLLDTYKFANSVVTATGEGIVKDNPLLEKNRRVEIRIYKKK
jgi:outer membrane protein OmpA-like peptidoglycan-associated protein